MPSLSVIFGALVTAVLVISLYAEHKDARQGADLTLAATLLVLAYVASNALVDGLGKTEALRWFSVIDLTGTLAGAWIYRRRPEAWRAVLALTYFTMCWVHVAYWWLAGPLDVRGYIAALNVGTAITFLAVAFQGGRHVAQAAGRVLSGLGGLGGVERRSVRGKSR